MANNPLGTAIDTELEQLAIDGGPRAMSGGPWPWPVRDEAVREALERAWHDGSWGRYEGPHVDRLVEDLATRHGVEFVMPCCSGTFAVELALRALTISAGDEVILAGYDFPGNFRAVEATQARPVLVDVEQHGCLMDLGQIESAVTPATRAILASHLHGTLVDMPRLIEIAQQHEVAVVEDACQVTGADVAGRVAGSWGDVGVLSFGGSKLLSAGRGGAILTSDPEVHQRAKIYCQRGNHAFPLSELQGAVLLPQLSALDPRNRHRAASVSRLREQMTGIEAMHPLVNRALGSQPAFYKLGWRYDAGSAGGTPIDEFVAALQAEGVPIYRGFLGFPGRSDRLCRRVGSLMHSRAAADTTLLLHHPVLLEPPQRMDELARAITKVATAYARRAGN